VLVAPTFHTQSFVLRSTEKGWDTNPDPGEGEDFWNNVERLKATPGIGKARIRFVRFARSVRAHPVLRMNTTACLAVEPMLSYCNVLRSGCLVHRMFELFVDPIETNVPRTCVSTR
jgi:hypothetical protein